MQHVSEIAFHSMVGATEHGVVFYPTRSCLMFSPLRFTVQKELLFCNRQTVSNSIRRYTRSRFARFRFSPPTGIDVE